LSCRSPCAPLRSPLEAAPPAPCALDPIQLPVWTPAPTSRAWPHCVAQGSPCHDGASCRWPSAVPRAGATCTCESPDLRRPCLGVVRRRLHRLGVRLQDDRHRVNRHGRNGAISRRGTAETREAGRALTSDAIPAMPTTPAAASMTIAVPIRSASGPTRMMGRKLAMLTRVLSTPKTRPRMSAGMTSWSCVWDGIATNAYAMRRPRRRGQRSRGSRSWSRAARRRDRGALQETRQGCSMAMIASETASVEQATFDDAFPRQVLAIDGEARIPITTPTPRAARPRRSPSL